MNAAVVFAMGLVAATPLLAQEEKREPMQGVKRGEPKPSVPTLVMGVNAAIGNVSEPGWPLIVSAGWMPEGPSTPAPPPPNLQVKMTNAAGAVIAIAFEPVPLPAGAAGEPHRYWLAAESATAGLAPGRYRVSVVSTGGAVSGWKIEPVEFSIQAPNPDRKGSLSLVKIHRAALLDRPDEALTEAEHGLTASPREIPLWIAKGDLLMKTDDPDGALDAYDRALSLQRKSGRESYPLQTRRKEAHVRALEKRGVLPTP